jgi:hypothetical protein
MATPTPLAWPACSPVAERKIDDVLNALPHFDPAAVCYGPLVQSGKGKPMRVCPFCREEIPIHSKNHSESRVLLF